MMRAASTSVVACLLLATLRAQATEALWEKFDSAGWQAYRDGKLLAAEQMLTVAVREARELGDADPRLGESLARLAWVELAGEKYAAANEHAEAALPITQQLRGKSPPEQLPLARTQFVRASIARRNAKSDDAINYYRQAEGVFRRIARDETLADTYLAMAQVLERQGAYLQAFGNAKQAAGIFDPQTAPSKWLKSQHLAARLGSAAGRYGEADPIFREFERLLDKNFGRSNQQETFSPEELARFWSNYAANDFKLGRSGLALQRYELARDELRAVVPDNDPALASFVDGQACVLTAQGKLDKALALVEWELNVVPQQGPVRADALASRGNIHFAAGKYDAAAGDYEASRVMRENAYGKHHPEVAFSMVGVARCYAALSRFEEAEALSKDAMRIQDASLGPGHPDLAVTWRTLAEIQLRSGFPQVAVSLSQQALDIQEFLPEESQSEMVPTLLQLGLSHWANGNVKEAEVAATRGFKLLLKLEEGSDLWLALHFDLSARLRHARNEHGAALNHFERALNVWMRYGDGCKDLSSGQQHPLSAETLLGMVAVQVSLKDPTIAEARWQEAYDVLSKSYSQRDVAFQLARLASVYEDQNKHPEAAWFEAKANALAGDMPTVNASPATSAVGGASQIPRANTSPRSTAPGRMRLLDRLRARWRR